MTYGQDTGNGKSLICWIVGLAAVLAACLALPASASAETEKGWRAMVRSEACVKGPDVTLGEIADPVNGTARAQWKTLSDIKLWKAATRVGRPVTIDRDKLRKVLRYYIGDMVGNLVLPSQLTVQTGGRVVSGAELKSRVVAFLTPRAEALGGEAEFKNLRLPLHIFFPNTYDKLVIDADKALKPGHNRIKLHGVTPDGRILSRRAGSVFLNIWKAVPVAARPLNRFERVTRDSVTFRRVNLAHNPEVWDGEGGPWRMARTLGRGQVFTRSHLERVPLIEKGETVYLKYLGRRVQLTVKAESQGEAGMGQQVAVKNLQSKKTIVATVVSDDTVIVR
ncbi:MAG: flagellar basal body P-ring formation protein FlgA [Desulfovibrionaceae bacterium]|nr:flagellar basal body P-ring formation protein FlgA [Desulfovibrionaceae bacterium]